MEVPDISERGTRRVLAHACAVAGVADEGAQLVRIGENAIWRLPLAQPVIVRIARHPAASLLELQVGRWLANEGFPATRLREDFPQGMVIDGCAVTWWEWISEHPTAPTYRDLAAVLRDFHQLPTPPFRLPSFRPMPLVEGRLTAATTRDPADLRYIRKLRDSLVTDYQGLRFELPPTTLHGDAHIGNLMRDQHGTIRLIDFECVAAGPAEWDLSVIGAAHQAFGWIDSEEYARCVRIYGWDPLAWSGFPTLRAIREVNMTSWLLQRAGESREIDEEIDRRIRDLQDDQAPRHWRAFATQ